MAQQKTKPFPVLFLVIIGIGGFMFSSFLLRPDRRMYNAYWGADVMDGDIQHLYVIDQEFNWVSHSDPTFNVTVYGEVIHDRRYSNLRATASTSMITLTMEDVDGTDVIVGYFRLHTEKPEELADLWSSQETSLYTKSQILYNILTDENIDYELLVLNLRDPRNVVNDKARTPFTAKLEIEYN